jgi:hypothetical protein
VTSDATQHLRQLRKLCRLVQPRTAIHYDGWKHFKEGRSAIESESARAPDIRSCIRWLRVEQEVEIAASP